MTQENYKGCKTISEENNRPFLLCKQFGPKILETDNACEIQLIRGKQSANSCEYKVIKTNEIFVQMTTENKWLFKFKNSKNIQLITINNVLVDIRLSGTGILEIMIEGQLRIDQSIYNIIKDRGNVNRTIKIEYPEIGSLPEFTFEILKSKDTSKIVEKQLRINNFSNKQHNEGLLKEGEEFENWKNNLASLEEQKKNSTINTTGTVDFSEQYAQ